MQQAAGRPLGLLDGQAVSSDLFAERGLHFGDGLFETIAIIDGIACQWERHYLRLREGCHRLSLPAPDAQQLADEVAQLSAGLTRAVLKIIVTAGRVTQGYARAPDLRIRRWLQTSPWPSSSVYAEQSPLRLQLCHIRLGSQPLFAGIKHLNRLEQVMARNELSGTAHEGVMCDQLGNVVEGISSNLLLREGDDWFTPVLSDCGVAGVVRGLVMDMADSHGQSVRPVKVSVDKLLAADAVYCTNSLLGVRPVEQIDKQKFAVGPDPLFLQQANAACFQAS